MPHGTRRCRWLYGPRSVSSASPCCASCEIVIGKSASRCNRRFKVVDLAIALPQGHLSVVRVPGTVAKQGLIIGEAATTGRQRLEGAPSFVQLALMVIQSGGSDRVQATPQRASTVQPLLTADVTLAQAEARSLPRTVKAEDVRIGSGGSPPPTPNTGATRAWGSYTRRQCNRDIRVIALEPHTLTPARRSHQAAQTHTGRSFSRTAAGW
jgi:hypothetical protein